MKKLWFSFFIITITIAIDLVGTGTSSEEESFDMLRGDEREYVLKTVRESGGWMLKFASDRLKKDKEIVLEAIDKEWWNGPDYTLMFADPQLLEKRDFILEAVKRRGDNLQYASEEFKNDKEIVMEAVKNDGFSLQYASEDLRNDKEIVMEAVKKWGGSLQFSSYDLRNDKEIALEAMKMHVWTFPWVSENLRGDKEIVLEAVRNEGNFIKHASEELRNDEEIVLEAIKQSAGSLGYADNELRNDIEFVRKCVELDGETISYVGEDIKRNYDENLVPKKRWSIANVLINYRMYYGMGSVVLLLIIFMISVNEFEALPVFSFLLKVLRKIIFKESELEQENKKLKQEIDQKEEVVENLKKKVTEIKLRDLDLSSKSEEIIFKKNRKGNRVKLGNGTFGMVFKVKYKGEWYAFKLIHDEFLKDPNQNEEVFSILEKEVKTVLLEHPNILRIIGFSKVVEYDNKFSIEENRVGILTELGKFDVGKLIYRSRISKRDIPFHLKLFLLFSVSNAMKFLHSPEVSLMHRDLKWENVIILAESGKCVLCDFGISKSFRRKIIQTYTFKRGSPWFIAPEISVKVKNKTRYNEKCDVFSFSIMICQLLFGLNADDLGTYFYEDFEEFKRTPEIRPKIDIIPNFFDENEKVSVVIDEDVINTMKKCWRKTPKERPSFDELTDFFEKKLKETKEGLELLENEEKSKEFLSFYKELIKLLKKNQNQ